MARFMNGIMPIGGMPTRTSGIEKNAAGVAMAMSQQVTKPAPPPTAPPSTTAMVGLGRPSRTVKHVAERILGWLRRLGLGARPPRRKVGAGAEMLAGAAQDHDPHGVVRGQRLELIAELIEHRLVERIAALGPVERDRRDAPGETSTVIVCSVIHPPDCTPCAWRPPTYDPRSKQNRACRHNASWPFHDAAASADADADGLYGRNRREGAAGGAARLRRGLRRGAFFRDDGADPVAVDVHGEPDPARPAASPSGPA